MKSQSFSLYRLWRFGLKTFFFGGGAMMGFYYFFIVPSSSEKSLYRYIENLSIKRTNVGIVCLNYLELPQAAVRRVVDGDTLVIQWAGGKDRFRYYGVNTPEREQPCYEEATLRNKELVGKKVYMVFDQNVRDKYGRLLAYVFNSEGVSVGGQLLKEGFAKAWKRDGRFLVEFKELEKFAKENQEGCLWNK